ncbi:MAG: sigma-70 family RNA polymerase sigma factor [Rhodomicrobium sp.]
MWVNDFADDRSLLDAAARGDRRAFVALVARHSERYFAVAYRVLGRREDAEEALQEAFLTLWARPEVWDASRGTKFTTWFYRVVLNKSFDILRKSAVFVQAADIGSLIDMLESGGDAELALDAEQRKRQVKRALGNLPERQRMAVALCFYEELPQSEAAGILRVSIKALESLLIRAKLSLRRELAAGLEP